MLAWRRTAVRQRVLVNLKGDKAFRGILWAKRGPLLVLKNVEFIGPGGAPVGIDGEVVIERSQVEFIQVPPAPSEV